MEHSNSRAFGLCRELFFQNGNHAGRDFHRDDQTEIVLHSTLAIISIKTSVKGYHTSKDIWTSVMNEKLAAFMKPDKEVDKYTVWFKKMHLVDHLPLGKNRKFSEMIFCFLRADHYATCEVIITDKVTNLGDRDGM